MARVFCPMSSYQRIIAAFLRIRKKSTSPMSIFSTGAQYSSYQRCIAETVPTSGTNRKEAMPATTTTKSRTTPTAKQLAALAALDSERLIAKSLEALFALNRRAKTFTSEREDIYDLKTRLLTALYMAGRAKVYTYEIQTGAECECPSCDRTFVIRVPDGMSAYDLEPYCYRCDTEADVLYGLASRWYIVETQLGYRFHQPDWAVTALMAEKAEPCEPHDPTQPQREIPDVGLTIAAQRRCVEMACELLEAQMAAA